ncbi:hypothetical protein ACT3CD_12690 [Geofilum sp. OHC36d9]|uniref:hypothetical protein n=1 Tax=Geofilum sp. OHC36d9 TaxID=3458413 RepID=UPI004033DD15
MKQANQYESAGLYEEAADLYIRSLQANSDNMESKVGLKKTGQLALDNKQKQFSQLYQSRQTKEAVYAYIDAENYLRQAESLGVYLNFDQTNRSHFEEVKTIYLDKLYKEGVNYLQQENFMMAEPLLGEIRNIDNSYKDTREQWIIARYEPIYRDGINFTSTGLNRKAYYAFDQVLRGAGGYKDAVSLREKALHKATITIALVPFFTSNQSQNTTAEQLQSHTISAVSNLKTPFYRVIYDPVINSFGKLNFITEPMLAIQLMKAAGLKLSTNYLLTAKITTCTQFTNPVKNIPQKAYLKITKNRTTESGERESYQTYEKVYYNQQKGNSGASLSISYMLINIETNEVLVSNVFNGSDADETLSASFDGNYKNLVPGTWKYSSKKDPMDRMVTSTTAINQLRKSFNTKSKEIISGNKLMENLIIQATIAMASDIERFNPEK